MYRIKITGNFFVMIQESSQREQLRHPIKDLSYVIFDEDSDNPLLRFVTLSGDLITKITSQTEFRLNDLLDVDGGAFVDFTALTGFLDVNLGKSNPQASGTITVNQSNVKSTLGSEIDSTKAYIIDGIVDLSGISITIPATGINLVGYTFDVSKLICSEEDYTMFISDITGSGNILAIDLAIEVTGVNSKVFNVISVDGFSAIEFTRVNFNSCSSLGVIDSYRQGLEVGTGRFGGTPELILKGTWLGGYFIETSIARNLENGNYSLYKAGSGFIMESRFRTNQNIDLPANVVFIDFSSVNFINPSTFQVYECIVTRDGVIDPEDNTIIPNISNTDVISAWANNQGLKNTFVGGSMIVTTEVVTVITNTTDFVDLQAIYSPSDLQHFEEDASGQLKHLGNSPREFRVTFDGAIDGGSNNLLTLKLVKWNSSTLTFEDIGSQTRQVNAFSGSRDAAFFNYTSTIELNKGDYIKWQVRNNSSRTNLTYELDGIWIVEAR